MSDFTIADVPVEHFWSTGVFAKQMKLPKDHYAVTHKHKYDHLSILASGKAIVELKNSSTEYLAPACIEIKAGEDHKIIAVEDIVWYCIHSISEADKHCNKIDDVLIEEK